MAQVQDRNRLSDAAVPSLWPYGVAMRVIVACEFSGVVRRAFRERGHDAWSCDLLAAEDGGPHLQGDALHWATDHSWEMMVAFPPCTHLAVSGARWFKACLSALNIQTPRVD